MKKIFYYLSLFAIIFTANSCFKIDDVAAPDKVLTGNVIDSTTGKPIQTEQGNGIRIKLDELSWSANPIPTYFGVKQDGTFSDTKIFAGRYRITPVDGPFVPLIQLSSTGDTISNRSKILNINASTKVNFTVEPFLKVEWVSDPVVNPDSTVTVQIKFTRGTTNPAYQFNVTDAYLFVSENTYVGNNNYDGRYSVQVSYSGTAGNAQLGQPITIKSKKMPGNRTYYIRVGARTADNVQKRYNYTDIKPVSINLAK
ncbi:MAG: DUF3823 domain-containing protein [Bacteroidota bacterium]|nr:DUF3823 domain-containing protein [Bacteroidota bacterium]